MRRHVSAILGRSLSSFLPQHALGQWITLSGKRSCSPHQLPVLRLMISAEENSTVPRIILREKSATTTVVLCHSECK